MHDREICPATRAAVLSYIYAVPYAIEIYLFERSFKRLVHSQEHWPLQVYTMQAANRLQKALRTGSGLTFGAWQMLPGSNHARVMARCGFDWICVDTEHGNIDGIRQSI